ncbi:ABC transporter permease subunit [Paenibacillus sp. FSL H8-0034]
MYTWCYLSYNSGVDPQLYEAAQMDGASRFQQVLNITLPSIKNIFFIL